MHADPRHDFQNEPTLDLGPFHVAVLGCGSVGSAMAWIAASSGIRSLFLADRDILEPANLRRHILGAEHLGQPKAAATAAFLRARLPDLLIQVSIGDFLEQPDSLRES